MESHDPRHPSSTMRSLRARSNIFSLSWNINPFMLCIALRGCKRWVVSHVNVPVQFSSTTWVLSNGRVNFENHTLNKPIAKKWKVCHRFFTSPRILAKEIRARDSNSRSCQFVNRCETFIGGLWFGGMPINQRQFYNSPRKNWLYRICSTSVGLEWRGGRRFTCSEFLGEVWQKGGRITHRFAWASSWYTFQRSGICGLGHWGHWYQGQLCAHSRLSSRYKGKTIGNQIRSSKDTLLCISRSSWTSDECARFCSKVLQKGPSISVQL